MTESVDLTIANRVAGFTLGGGKHISDALPSRRLIIATGYSYKTSQYGLTIDNIAAFELVLPNGTVTTVTSDNDDLWFALRGGFNNFVRTPQMACNAYKLGL